MEPEKREGKRRDRREDRWVDCGGREREGGREVGGDWTYWETRDGKKGEI